jgi:hypothetical protein
MHDDDEFKAQQAELAEAFRILKEVERQMPGTVPPLLKKKMKELVAETLEEMRTHQAEMVAFFERDVSDLDYAELRKLYSWSFQLFLHALSADWE